MKYLSTTFLKRIVRGKFSWIYFFRHLINLHSRFGNDNFIRKNLIGYGLEVGALSSPFRFARHTKVEYADVYSVSEAKLQLSQIPIDNLYKGNFVIPKYILNPPHYTLDDIPDNNYDFVFSSHVLEHSPNILSAIKDQLRVVKKEGLVYGVIPDKNYTYDFKRKTVKFEVLVDRFNNRDCDIPPEYVRDLLLLTSDHPMYEDKSESALVELINNPSLMHHYFVYDCEVLMSILKYVQLNFCAHLRYFWSEGQNMHFMLQKSNDS